jgi:hypothetical protein
MRHLSLTVFAAALLCSATAGAQDEKPDLSGNDPHWIRDPVSQCWAGNPHPQEGESISWSGACEGGLLTGPGTLTWSLKGRVIGRDSGTFKGGILSGRGMITSVDGTFYRGDFPGRGVMMLPDGREVQAQSLREIAGWSIEQLPQ